MNQQAREQGQQKPPQGGGTASQQRPLNAEQLKSIGNPGKSRNIRQVKGTAEDARRFFDSQVIPSTIREIKPGTFVGQDANGVTFSFRAVSSDQSFNVPTIDVNGIQGLRKIKFVGD